MRIPFNGNETIERKEFIGVTCYKLYIHLNINERRLDGLKGETELGWPTMDRVKRVIAWRQFLAPKWNLNSISNRRVEPRFNRWNVFIANYRNKITFWGNFINLPARFPRYSQFYCVTGVRKNRWIVIEWRWKLTQCIKMIPLLQFSSGRTYGQQLYED